MNKRNILIGSLVSLTLVSNVALADEPSGEQLFQTYCGACHAATGPATIAPPVFAMVDHVKKEYPDQEGFVNRVVGWVANPQADQALMPGAIEKFGLMPKLGYPAEQVQIIAEYLYDGEFEKPKGQGGNH